MRKPLIVLAISVLAGTVIGGAVFYLALETADGRTEINW